MKMITSFISEKLNLNNDSKIKQKPKIEGILDSEEIKSLLQHFGIMMDNVIFPWLTQRNSKKSYELWKSYSYNKKQAVSNMDKLFNVEMSKCKRPKIELSYLNPYEKKILIEVTNELLDNNLFFTQDDQDILISINQKIKDNPG